MPKMCVICKKEPLSGNVTRSFHQFPKNTELRQKWMEVTGIKEVKKVHAVCSDHFDEDSYHQTDGNTKIRRLLSTAVPLLCKNNSVLQQITNNIVLVPQSAPTAHKSCSMVIDGFSLSNSLNSSSNMNNVVTYLRHEDSSCSNDSDDLEDPSNARGIVSESIISLPQEKNTKITTVIKCDKNCINLKGRQSAINEGTVPTKKFRFMDGYQPTSITRKDFVSNEAWQRFVKLMKYKKSQLATANKKCWRRGKRLSYYKELLKRLGVRSKEPPEDQIDKTSGRQETMNLGCESKDEDVKITIL